MKSIVSAAVALALAAHVAALGAADKHAHAEAKPRHGGVVVEVSEIQYELVAKDGALLIHVSDHGKPVSTAGWSGRISSLGGAEKVAAELKPAASNTLEARGDFKVKSGTRLLASIQPAGKKPVQVRFTVK